MSLSERKVVDFVASQPARNSDVVKLQHAIESFDSVRRRVKSAENLFFCKTENQVLLAHEIGVDSFMVEDVVGALFDGEISEEFADFIDHGFWTCGRQVPRFGIPWGNLVFYDESKTVELLVRHGGSFLVEDEDPLLWIRCPVVSTGNTSYESLAELSADCKVLDMWWRLESNSIAGKLVFY